jgi:hypothetical protein
MIPSAQSFHSRYFTQVNIRWKTCMSSTELQHGPLMPAEFCNLCLYIYMNLFLYLS